MNNLIHILGSDIPHHNLTVLRFFNDILVAVCPPSQTRHFMVVTKDNPDTSFQHFNQLNIELFNTKQALTKALIHRAISAPDEQYFLHGQFNPFLWLVMLTGKIHPKRLNWHIWGADLYEDSRHLCYQLFYLLRRLAQKRVGHVFMTNGDLTYYRQYHTSVPASLLYFPSRLAPTSIDVFHKKSDKLENKPLTLLVGNSGDASNRHSQALYAIYHRFGTSVHIIMPMGYPSGNDTYIATVQAQAERYFSPGQVQILSEKLIFEDYITLLKKCDIGYFLSPRQQGIGTINLLIQLKVPFVLNRKNPFCQDLLEQRVPILYEDEPLDATIIKEAYRRMLAVNPYRLSFFYPNILEGWRHALSIATGILL